MSIVLKKQKRPVPPEGNYTGAELEEMHDSVKAKLSYATDALPGYKKYDEDITDIFMTFGEMRYLLTLLEAHEAREVHSRGVESVNDILSRF